MSHFSPAKPEPDLHKDKTQSACIVGNRLASLAKRSYRRRAN
jgi:hypothetical protein